MGEKYPALRYSDYMGDGYKNGVWTVECNSWKEFKDTIEKYEKYSYLWRGQSCEKQLLPSIYRNHNISEDINIDKHLNKFKKCMLEAGVLEEFLKSAKNNNKVEYEKAFRKYCDMINPKEDDKDLKDNYEKKFFDDIYWSIGQHHGLETPLLDWTMDPYKALFFTFCERKENDDRRIVYGLAEKSRLLLENRRPKKRYIEFLANLDFVKTMLVSSDFNKEIGQMLGRIKAQEGLFTRTLYKEDIEKHITKCYNVYKEHRKEEIVFLIKILIPNVIRKDFLEKLEEKKITYKTMYPDLKGAALHCNLKFELIAL